MTNDKGNPNDQNPNRSAGLLFGTILHGGTHNAARNWGSSFGFMKRIDQSEFVHCCQNTLALPRRTKSADKSDALQTLRALLRHPAGAKRLECVRLQRRFRVELPDDIRAVCRVHEQQECARAGVTVGVMRKLDSALRTSPAIGVAHLSD